MSAVCVSGSATTFTLGCGTTTTPSTTSTPITGWVRFGTTTSTPRKEPDPENPYVMRDVYDHTPIWGVALSGFATTTVFPVITKPTTGTWTVEIPGYEDDEETCFECGELESDCECDLEDYTHD